MMPQNLFQLQLMETFGNRRRTFVRLGVSVLLALPFIFVNMPPGVKTSGIVMVILFTTFMGSAIAHARLCEDGRFSRLSLLPTSRPMMWLDLILASTIARIVPTLIILTGFIFFNTPVHNGVSLISLASLLCQSILMLILLGTLTGHLAGNNGQVHLFGALICVMVAFISGLTPGVQKIMWLANITRWNPLNRLLSALVGLTDDSMTINTTELSLLSLFLGLFGLVMVLRWTAGGKYALAQNN